MKFGKNKVLLRSSSTCNYRDSQDITSDIPKEKLA